jgi:hypothetical protein
MNKLRDVYYSIKYGIINLIRWFSVIWKDRDWDDHFIYILLKKKLEYMEKFFRSDDAWSTNAKQDADNIKHAINLLDRIIDGVHLEEAMKPFYEKYPDYEFKFEFKSCEDGIGSKLVNNDTPEQKELQYKCYREADKLEDNDFDELFSFLRKHVREWWD